jgi:hypothetical protein
MLAARVHGDAPNVFTVAMNRTPASTVSGATIARAASILAYFGSASADMTVYDEQRVGGTCSAAVSALPRAVPLRFTSVGPALIQVRGRAEARNSAGLDSMVVVEKTVIVR